MRDLNERVVGTCSICGGPVVLPMVFWSVVPPVARCAHCGAVEQESYGPVIPMQPTRYGKPFWRSDCE